jgi:hypothetical protein
MIFNFFKKEKNKSDTVEIISRIESGQLKAPKVRDNIIKLTQEEFHKYSDKHHENFKFTETLPKDKYPTLIGVIEGYHPYVKDIGSLLMAVVEWPVYKKSERTFVVDCTLLGKTSGGSNLTYPGEGTWIFFRELGEQKDTDGILRTYGIAETIFTEQLIQLALKEYKKKAGINNDL